MASLTIGALAQEAGVGAETVRFDERRGLGRRRARPGTRLAEAVRNAGFAAEPAQ